MKKLLSVAGIVMVPALLTMGACGRKEAGKPPAIQDQATAPLPPDLKTVGVDAVAKDPKAHAGRVGIEGVVAQVFKDRGAFTLIDSSEFEACGETGCAEYTLPVQVPKQEFEGDLPASEETVLAIGDVQPTDTGYLFVVQEVRRKGSVILRRTKGAQ